MVEMAILARRAFLRGFDAGSVGLAAGLSSVPAAANSGAGWGSGDGVLSGRGLPPQ
jgi:hypothetical protein